MKKFSYIGIFGIVVFILISISLYTYFSTGSPSSISFSSFLDVLAKAPNVDISWSMVDLTIYSDWGVFNFVKYFLNAQALCFEFSLFIVGALWQGLNYIVYFFNVLFGFKIFI